MKPSNIAYDSISILDNYFFAQNHSVLGIIVQDSIRFQPFKVFAIYNEDRYLGNYVVSTKVVFNTVKFPDIFCRMLWNKPRNECNNEIRLIYKKGKFSDKSQFALVSFHYHSTNENYKINRVKEVEPINQETNEISNYVQH
jgi:hypothetical protein